MPVPKIQSKIGGRVCTKGHGIILPRWRDNELWMCNDKFEILNKK